MDPAGTASDRSSTAAVPPKRFVTPDSEIASLTVRRIVAQVRARIEIVRGRARARLLLTHCENFHIITGEAPRNSGFVCVDGRARLHFCKQAVSSRLLGNAARTSTR